jgi:integrase
VIASGSPLEAILDFADVDDLPNPFRPFGANKLIKKKSAPRPAATKPADVAKLFKAMWIDRTDTRITEVGPLALRFLALTGVRPGELIGAKWGEINMGEALWVIPARRMKGRKEHWVPLSDQAMAILRRMQALHDGKQVFSVLGEKPLNAATMGKRLRWMGFRTDKDHCSHGYRSTLSSALNSEVTKSGDKAWDRDAIELTLAHVNESSVRSLYNRWGREALLETRRKMLQHWADKIDTIVSSGAPVPLRKQEIAEIA